MRHILAVDLGGSQCRSAVADDQFRLHGRLQEATDHRRGPDGVVAQIASLCRQSLAEQRIALSQVELLAVACPGPLDSRSGVVFDPPNLLGWNEVPLQDMLHEALGIRTVIVNDANAAALAEYHLGAGRGTRNLVYLTISTGIGGGVVAGGMLLEGTSGSGGELGHMTVDRHGPVCPCGNVGCVEAVASGRAIARRYAEAHRAEGPEVGMKPASARDIALAAAQGHEPEASIFRDAASAVGTAVVNCINIFNPDVVVLGGGITQAGDLLFGPILQAVHQYSLPHPRAAVRVCRAEFGADVGLIGAAAFGVMARLDAEG